MCAASQAFKQHLSLCIVEPSNTGFSLGLPNYLRSKIYYYECADTVACFEWSLTLYYSVPVHVIYRREFNSVEQLSIFSKWTNILSQ